MTYQFHKVNKNRNLAANSGNDDLSSALLDRLTGKSKPKPRKPIAYNLWAKANANAIDSEVDNRRVNDPTPGDALNVRRARGQAMALRGVVTRELFAALPEDVRLSWRDRADAVGVAAMAEWEATEGGDPSTDPADRQR